MDLSSLMVMPPWIILRTACRTAPLNPTPQLLLPSILGTQKKARLQHIPCRVLQKRATHLEEGQPRGHISWGPNHSTPQSRHHMWYRQQWQLNHYQATYLLCVGVEDSWKRRLWDLISPSHLPSGLWGLLNPPLEGDGAWGQDSRVLGGIHTFLTLGSSLRGSMPGRPFLPPVSSMAWVFLFWTTQDSLSRGAANRSDKAAVIPCTSQLSHICIYICIMWHKNKL